MMDCPECVGTLRLDEEAQILVGVDRYRCDSCGHVEYLNEMCPHCKKVFCCGAGEEMMHQTWDKVIRKAKADEEKRIQKEIELNELMCEINMVPEKIQVVKYVPIRSLEEWRP